MSNEPSQPAASPAGRTAPRGDIFADPVFIRNTKIAIAIMSTVLLVGFIALVARIFYMSRQAPAKAPVAAVIESAPSMAQAFEAARLAAAARLDLPPGATVRSVSLSGARLAVHYEAPQGTGIAIVDLVTGQTLTRIEIVTAQQR